MEKGQYEVCRDWPKPGTPWQILAQDPPSFGSSEGLGLPGMGQREG